MWQSFSHFRELSLPQLVPFFICPSLKSPGGSSSAWADSGPILLSPNPYQCSSVLFSAGWAPGEQQSNCWATSWLLWTIGEDSSPNLRVAGATQPKPKKSQLIQGTSRGKVFPTHCGRSLCCGLCPFLFVQVSVSSPDRCNRHRETKGTQATAKLSSLELRLAVACALFCCR